MDAMHSPASTENLLFWRTCARWYDRFVNRAFPEYLDIVDRIVADATPSERLLEVATGTGNVALSLAKGCVRIDAIDYSSGMLRGAKRKASERGVRNVNFARQNVYTLDYPDALFDTVVCAHALQVLKDAPAAVAEMRRVLKPRGILIAPTFCFGQELGTRMLAVVPRLSGLRVYQKWTFDGFRRFIEGCGFEVIRDDFVAGAVPRCYLIGRKTEEPSSGLNG